MPILDESGSLDGRTSGIITLRQSHEIRKMKGGHLLNQISIRRAMAQLPGIDIFYRDTKIDALAILWLHGRDLIYFMLHSRNLLF